MGRLAKTIGTLGISLLTAMPMMAINNSEAECIEEKLEAASTLVVEAPNSSRQMNHLATHTSGVNLASTLLSDSGKDETSLEGTVLDQAYAFDRGNLNIQYPQVEVKANGVVSPKVSGGAENLIRVKDSSGLLYSNADFTAGTVSDDALAKACTAQLSEEQVHMGKVFPKIFRVNDNKNFKGYIAPTIDEGVYEWRAVNSDYSGAIEANIDSNGDLSGNMSLTMEGSGQGEACLVNPVSGLERCVSTGGQMSVPASDIVGNTVYSNVDGIIECVEDEFTHCLGKDADADRYMVTVDWRTNNDSGRGKVSRDVSGDRINLGETGLFWFFGETNHELMVKVLDACSFSNYIWVFGAAPTDQGYTFTVTDTKLGNSKSYSNEIGVQSPAYTDTKALPCEPGS